MSPRKTVLVLAALAALGALAGCGKQAELERPGPLVGRGGTPGPGATARDQAAARARADGEARSDPQGPQSIEEVRNQGVTPREKTGLPMGSDPNPPRPEGLINDPVSRPSSPQ